MDTPQPSDNYIVAALVAPTPVPVQTSATIIEGPVECSCVTFAKQRVGREHETWGNAWEIEPNIDVPELGDFVLTTEGGGHMAQLIGEENGAWSVIDANYVPCTVTIRELPKDSPVIRGYFRP